jgi:hypothetical protein
LFFVSIQFCRFASQARLAQAIESIRYSDLEGAASIGKHAIPDQAINLCQSVFVDSDCDFCPSHAYDDNSYSIQPTTAKV